MVIAEIDNLLTKIENRSRKRRERLAQMFGVANGRRIGFVCFILLIVTSCLPYALEAVRVHERSINKPFKLSYYNKYKSYLNSRM